MISVRTPTGKLLHLASSMNVTLTFCGRGFHPGVDEAKEIYEVPKFGVCSSCHSSYVRRTNRKAHETPQGIWG